MSVELKRLPWYTDNDVAQIVQAFNNTHAILLNGSQGIGKSNLAAAVSKQLLMRSNTDSCAHLFEAGTHPDLHVLTSAFAYQYLDAQLQQFSFRYLQQDAIEKKRLSRQIGVDTIRTLIGSMNEASSTGGCKLTVVYPVEHLNINSANAILKFLEEPSTNTFLILISHDIARLPATVRSRCMRINIATPDEAIASQWLAQTQSDKAHTDIENALELASYRPLIAAEYLSENQQALVVKLTTDISDLVLNNNANLINIARKWSQHKQTDFILRWSCQFFAKLIKLKISGSVEIRNTTSPKTYLPILKSFSCENLFNIYDYLKSIHYSYDGIVDDNLLIEDVLQTIVNSSNTRLTQ